MGGKSKKSMEETGLLLHWMEAIGDQVVKISIGRKLERGRPNRLDMYILGWFLIQSALLVTLVFVNVSNLVENIIIAVLSYHLLEIAITNFDSVFIKVMQKKRHHSIPRLFSLVLANYIEVILIFTIIFDLLYNQADIVQSLNYSVSLATLAGASFQNPTSALNAAAVIEMMLGIFFVTGAIGTIANYLGSQE